MRRALAALALFGSAALAQAGIAPAWSVYPGFEAPGSHGIQILDLDGDGRNEAVVTGYSAEIHPHAGPQFLAVLADAGGEMRVHRIAPLPSGEWLRGKIHVRPASPAGPAQVLATVEWNYKVHLVAYGGTPLERIGARRELPRGFNLRGVADVDGDGAPELYGLWFDTYSGGRPQVLDFATLALEWEDLSRTSTDLSAGQLDGDAALELVYDSHVVDGATHADAWTWTERFSGPAVFGNFDDDRSTREFATLDTWGMTRVVATSPAFVPFDAKWTGQAGDFRAGDVDGDGIDEIVVGETQWGSVVAYRPGDWSTAFDFRNREHGVSALAVGNLDADAAMEVVFGAGLTSNGPDALTVFDAASEAVQYARPAEYGPHASVLAADFDGDGRQELAHVARYTNDPDDVTRMAMLDPETGRVLRRVTTANRWTLWPGTRLQAAQLDGDPQLEIIAGGGYSHDIQVRVVDSLTLDRQWVVRPDDDAIDAVAVVPSTLNGDGAVFALGAGRIFALDGVTGETLWQSAEFAGDGPYVIEAANIDADPAPEVVFSTGAGLHAIDTGTRLAERSLPLAEAPIALRVEGTGTACRVVLVHADRLARRRCEDLTLASERPLATASAQMIRFLGDSYARLVVSDGERVFAQDGTQRVLESAKLGPQLGWHDFGAVHATPDSLTVFTGDALGLHRIDLINPRIWRHGFE